MREQLTDKRSRELSVADPSVAARMMPSAQKRPALSEKVIAALPTEICERVGHVQIQPRDLLI